MWWVVPADVAVFMIWGAVPGILLPQQVTLVFGEEGQANVANLTVISTLGAFAAMLAQPIADQISDRTRSRFGRRAPWIVLGALAGALSLIGLAFAGSLVGFIVAWTLVQVCYNFARGPLSAIMPDRVPTGRRGTFAVISGIGLMVGAIGGQVVGSVFFHSITAGYITFAVISVVVLTVFVLVDRPETVIPVLGLLSLVGIIVSTVVSGPLPDRIGRRKPFVFGSAAFVSLAFLLPWMWQDLTAWMIMTFVAGFGFGMFQAADTALISDVLSSAKSFAKDLGVVNIAATLPTLAIWPIRSAR